MNQCRFSGDKARIIRIEKIKASKSLSRFALKGASKNSEFAQMQGVGKISPRRICAICKQEIFSTTQQLG
jgi:hypothetical protein